MQKNIHFDIIVTESELINMIEDSSGKNPFDILVFGGMIERGELHVRIPEPHEIKTIKDQKKFIQLRTAIMRLDTREHC